MSTTRVDLRSECALTRKTSFLEVNPTKRETRPDDVSIRDMCCLKECGMQGSVKDTEEYLGFCILLSRKCGVSLHDGQALVQSTMNNSVAVDVTRAKGENYDVKKEDTLEAL